ncbi:MAG: Tm-1-like ATP-binding domain-containing protein [Desulfomonilaceae bacterium]|nr:Tm-1-like ATP-binding domain-containing protein [Desulfomonilaceae bacterium]
MIPTVAVVATLDTKGEEVGYLKRLIEGDNCETVLIDVGTLNAPTVTPDVPREIVAERAGSSVEKLLDVKDRRLAVETVIEGGATIVEEMYHSGRLSAIISVGGGTGTHIGMGIMRRLPLGVPKLMVSTVASRDMSTLMGTKDITVMHSVTDILGLNAVTKRILANAAGAVAGMAQRAGKILPEKPIVGLTSFGFITQGAMKVKKLLEESGYDVAPFHANGTGGMAMEDLIDQGLITGVLDFALHEFADSMYGGYCGGIGPGRLESAGARGIPQVIVPGGLDCIVLEFNSEETKPPHLKDRKVFWYDFRSGVRTSVHDVLTLAGTISEKLNRAKGPVKFVVPLRGWSEADAAGGPLFDPHINGEFVSELKSRLNHGIEVLEIDAHINDDEFAKVVVAELHAFMKVRGQA